MKDLLATIDLYDDDTPGMADGGRIGFYRGEKVVKSHGKQIKDLTEAGESSVSIAKKLRLKQQDLKHLDLQQVNLLWLVYHKEHLNVPIVFVVVRMTTS